MSFLLYFYFAYCYTFLGSTYLSGNYIREYPPRVKTYISLLLLSNWQLNMQSAQTKTCFKFSTKTQTLQHRQSDPLLFHLQRIMLQNTPKAEYLGPFSKKELVVLVESPRRSDSGGRGKKDITMCDYIKKFLNLALTLGSRNL